jgi:hypothetical protein
MDDEFFRETAPAGDLAKPPRKPPTAVGVATLPSPDRKRPSPVHRSRRRWFTKLFSKTLDVIDEVGDAVATALKLRPSTPRT